MHLLTEPALYPFDFLKLLLGFVWCGMIFCWGGFLASRFHTNSERLWQLYFPIGLALTILVLFPFSATGFVAIIGWIWGLAGLVLFAVYSRPDRAFKKAGIVSDPASWIQKNGNFLLIIGLLIFLSSFIVLIRFQQYFDVLSYHLPLAHEIASGSGFGLDAFDYYQALPFGAFLIYTPVLSGDDSLFDPGITPILWLTWLNICFLGARICGQFRCRRWVQNLAFLMMVLFPSLWVAIYNTQTDLLTALLTLTGVERLLSGLTSGDRKRLLLAGILIGTTYSIKQSALAIYLIPFLLMLGCAIPYLLESEKKKQRLLSLAFPVIGLAIAMSPWLLRSAVLTGNPFFPLFGTHETWSADQQTFLLSQHQRVAPFSSDFFANLFARIDMFGYAIQMSTPERIVTLVPPLGIVSLAGIVLLRKNRLMLGALAIFMLSGYAALSLVGLAPTRFGLGLSLISICIALIVITKLFAKQILWAMLPVGLAIFTTISVNLPIYLQGWQSDAFDPGRIFPMELLEAQHKSAASDPDSKTWMLFESKERLISGNVVSNKVWNPLPFAEEIKTSDSVGEFVAKLQSAGVTQVVVNDQELGRLVDFYGNIEGEPDPANWRATGVRSSEHDYARLLSEYPPVRMAKLSQKDCLLLARFLRQTFSQTRSRTLLYQSETDQFGQPIAWAAIWITEIS